MKEWIIFKASRSNPESEIAYKRLSKKNKQRFEK